MRKTMSILLVALTERQQVCCLQQSPCLRAEPADPAENPRCWLLLRVPLLQDQIPEAEVYLREGTSPQARPP